ncbi:MAG: hypothetical protein Q7S45_02710 [Candidatus Curtissbacteria bacterium]|nr:hypothetical protein [Candidatus Curtissbacteria bacterium]
MGKESSSILESQEIREVVDGATFRSLLESYEYRRRVATAIKITKLTGREAGFVVFKTIGHDSYALTKVSRGDSDSIDADFENPIRSALNGYHYPFISFHTHPNWQSFPTQLNSDGSSDHFPNPLITGGNYEFWGKEIPNRLNGMVLAVSMKEPAIGYSATLWQPDSSFALLHPTIPRIVPSISFLDNIRRRLSGGETFLHRSALEALNAEGYYHNMGKNLVALYFAGDFYKLTSPFDKLENLRDEHFSRFGFSGALRPLPN